MFELASSHARFLCLVQLVKALPKRLRLSNWFLIYSTYVHGITLTTLYHKVQQLEEPGESILVIRDNAGHVRRLPLAGRKQGRCGGALTT